MGVGRGRFALGAGLLIVVGSIAWLATRESGPSEDTRRMAARLARVANDGDPRTNPFAVGERVTMLEEIPPPADVRTRVALDVRLALALLTAGRTREAIAELERARAAVDRHAPEFSDDFRAELLSRLAIAHLRAGEERHCLLAHTPDSCLLPLRGGGIHADPSDARRATAVYRDLLEIRPDDAGERWLWNLAAMAAGDHPEAIPERWRIPEATFASDEPFRRFRDVAHPAGVAVRGLSGGGVLEDFDRDGHLDLLVSSWGPGDPLRFFRGRGDGTFDDASSAAGLEGLTGGLNLVHADVENDGDPDVLVLRGAWLGANGRHPNSLLRNRDGRRFDDGTEAAGLLEHAPTQTAAWADFDGDGWIDLFVGNESFAGNRFPCRLYRNRGDGTFREVAGDVGLDVVGFVKAAVWGDVDDDGRPDLYLSLFGEPNRLFRNEGPADGDSGWRFRDVTDRAGVAEPVDSFPAWFWDADNDGDLDLFVAGYSSDFLKPHVGEVAAHVLGFDSTGALPRVYRNRGDGTFEDVTAGSGLGEPLLAMGANHGDLDGDGWLDVIVGTGGPDYRDLVPNRVFRNVAGEHFADVTTAGGFGHLQKGHAISVGDVDRDGDEDVHVVLGGAFPGDVYPNALLRNPGPVDAWVGLRLEGTRSNRSAIGARIRIVVATPAGRREIHRLVSSGGSFGASPFERTIGLGDATRIESVTIRWPILAEPEDFLGVELGRFWSIREGDGLARLSR